jgi:hypothetical protein
VYINLTVCSQYTSVPVHTRRILLPGLAPRSLLNSVSGLVSMIWYRIPFAQSELSISTIPPTDSPTVRQGRHP